MSTQNRTLPDTGRRNIFGAVFAETLRREFRETLLWGLGFAAMAFFSMSFVPLFDAFDIVEFMEDMPPFLVGMLGIGEDLSVLSTPEGIIALVFFAKFTIFFAVYPVVLALRVTANEEKDGTLDVVLSLPIRRGQVIIEKSLAYILMIAVTLAMTFVGIVLGTVVIDVQVNLNSLAIMTVSLLPMLTFIFMFVVLAGAFFQRYGVVIALSVLLVAGGYILQTVTSMVSADITDFIARFSVFTYYDVEYMLSTGMPWAANIGLLIVALLMGIVAIVGFQMRDVA